LHTFNRKKLTHTYNKKDGVKFDVAPHTFQDIRFQKSEFTASEMKELVLEMLQQIQQKVCRVTTKECSIG